jgi:hypothetical protein
VKKRETRRGPRLWRGVGTLLMLLTLAGPAIQPVAAQGGGEAPLDLAAMVLTQEDLADEGLEGFGLDQGFFISFDEEVGGLVSAGYDAGATEATLEDAGWGRRYLTGLISRRDPDDVDSRVAMRVMVGVTEYEDADGAEVGFAYIEEEQVPTAEDLEGTETIGDTSEITALEQRVSDAEDESISALNLTFITGNLVGDVTLQSFSAPDFEGPEPDVETIEALGTLLLERIETVRDEGGPDLGSLVLSLNRDDAVLQYYSEGYFILYGDALEKYSESEEEFEIREDRMVAIVDGYEFFLAFQPGAEARLDDPSYIARIYRLEDEDAASDWVASAEDTLSETPGYSDVEALEDSIQIGDESVAFAYTYEVDTSLMVDGRAVVVRVGDLVASIQVDAGTGIELDVAVELAEQQAECLEEGACLDPIPVPSAMSGGEATNSGSDEETSEPETGETKASEEEETPGADDEQRAESGTDGASYTSPTYGYTLEWDEDEWTANTETVVAPDRGTLILDAADGTGFVYVEGYEAYDGDPEDCLEGAADELLSTEGYVDVEPLELDRDLAQAPEGGAVAAYSLTYETSEGQEVPGVAYVACQTLVEGEAVLAVSYVTFAAEYEDGIEAVQDVMASLELAEQ